MLNPGLINQLSEQPGVYLIKNSHDEVIYVGKAKSLKKRLSQYLRAGGDGRALMPYLQKEAQEIDTIIVTSETEALLLENTLIKRYQPKYNVLLKDDKSYLAFCINKAHRWPRLDLIRYRSPIKSQELFGPYSALAARQLQQVIEENFALRRCSDHELRNRTRPCLLYGMKKCLAPCVKMCSEAEYQEHVEQVRQFLSGKLNCVLKALESKISLACEKLDFERAEQLHQLRIRLEKVNSPQAVDTLEGEDAELLYVQRQADKACFCTLSVRAGKVINLSYEVSDCVEEDHAVLLQSLALQKILDMNPSEIRKITFFLDLPTAELQTLNQALKEALGHTISLKTVQRGTAREWQEIAKRNAQHQLQKKGIEKAERFRRLGQLKASLELHELPVWIECMDTSHHAGKEHVGSAVAFYEGLPLKSGYRRYRIEKGHGDDLAATAQILKRRFERAREQGKWPNLLIIDGGATHLKLAHEIMHSYDLVGLELVALSKEKGKHDKGLNEECLHKFGRQPLYLDPRNSTLHLLQQIRDEAHRFAIEYHRKRQSKLLTHSILDDIPGIGPKKRHLLMRHFGSVAALKRAGMSELEKLTMLTSKDRERIVEFLDMRSE